MLDNYLNQLKKTLNSGYNLFPHRSLERRVERQFIQQSSQKGVVGNGRYEDVVARDLIGIYDRAIRMLDEPLDKLRVSYPNIIVFPENLITIIMRIYAIGKSTKEETTQKLLDLQDRTEQYLRELGAKPEDADKVSSTFYLPRNSRGKKNKDYELSFNRNLLNFFVNFSVRSQWSNLAERLEGREPTADELINSVTEAYKTTHAMDPSLGRFKDEKDFNNFLDKFQQDASKNKEEYLKKALPEYNAAVNK